jgi:hypothetical protein
MLGLKVIRLSKARRTLRRNQWRPEAIIWRTAGHQSRRPDGDERRHTAYALPPFWRRRGRGLRHHGRYKRAECWANRAGWPHERFYNKGAGTATRRNTQRHSNTSLVSSRRPNGARTASHRSTTEPAWLRDGGRTKLERPAAGTTRGDSGRTRITRGGTTDTEGTWGLAEEELEEDSA